MKYYAIRQINGESVDEILTNWDECKSKVSGVRSEYKSFKTEKEAKEYLGNYIQEENEEETLLNKENHIYYVDGSYLNNRIGWGFVYVKHNEVVTKMCGGVEPNEFTSRNITGELTSCIMAVRHAISNGLKEVYIVNDYQGISSYVTGAWKPKTKESKEYTDIMNKLKGNISIKFIKVKGHKNNKFNDMVDEMAKLGTSL